MHVFTDHFEQAQSHFLDLITSIPELVESYEVVDANGASARRYMINDPQSHLEAEAATQNTKPASLESEQGCPRHDKNITSAKAVLKTTVTEDKEEEKQSALQRDFDYMQRRYRSGFAITASSASGKFLKTLENI